MSGNDNQQSFWGTPGQFIMSIPRGFNHALFGTINTLTLGALGGADFWERKTDQVSSAITGVQTTEQQDAAKKDKQTIAGNLGEGTGNGLLAITTMGAGLYSSTLRAGSTYLADAAAALRITKSAEAKPVTSKPGETPPPSAAEPANAEQSNPWAPAKPPEGVIRPGQQTAPAGVWGRFTQSVRRVWNDMVNPETPASLVPRAVIATVAVAQTTQTIAKPSAKDKPADGPKTPPAHPQAKPKTTSGDPARMETSSDLLNAEVLAVDAEHGLGSPANARLASRQLESTPLPPEAADRAGWQQQVGTQTNRHWGMEAAANIRGTMGYPKSMDYNQGTPVASTAPQGQTTLAANAARPGAKTPGMKA